MVFIPTQTFFNLSKERQKRIVDAAINEFAAARFENATVSNIVKEAGIARGSFYQYFEDKKDLYLYMFQLIGERKIEYLSEDLKNPQELAFFDLFRELYKSGMKFAVENPKYIQISNLLKASKDLMYKEVFQKNIEIARTIYIGMIERDQEAGRMDKHIDPSTLANIVINMTMNIAFDDALLSSDGVFDFEAYVEEIDKVIYIFEKGITGN